MTDANAKLEVKTEIGYAWNFQADLGNGRTFSLSGNFIKGISANEMNSEVDKVRSVFDRQQAQSAARGAEESVEQLILRRDSAKEDLERINSKGDGRSLSSAERQQKEAAEVHLEKMNKDIEYKMGVLEKLKKEAK